MTQPERGDFLTTQAVAAELGVSPMRVRQMVGEGKLPEPTNLGTRLYVWHRADIAAVKAQLAGQSPSPASGLLRPPTQRLPRVRDEVIQIPAWSGLGPVHVRVWHGVGPEGPRTVALVGQLHGGPRVQVHLEDIVATVAELLPVPPREAVWFSYRPGDELHPQDVDNLIWRPTSDNTDPARGGRVRHVFRWAEQRARSRDDAPRWHRPASLPEVERIVGSPVEAYPAPAYTAESIEAWQRTGRQVEVVHDTIGYQQLLTAAATLTQVSTRDPEQIDARNAAVHLLVDDIRERLAMLTRGAWEDGTRPPFAKIGGLAWPTTWAARLVKPQPLPTEHELIDSHPEPFVIPRDPAEHGPLHTLLEQLRRWSQTVDSYADQPDPVLHSAVETAAGLLAFYLGVYDKQFRANDHPDTVARVYEVVGRWDRAYLAQLAEADLLRYPRAHRMLTERLRPLVAEPVLVRAGMDPAGRLVLHYPGEPRRKRTELYAVEWPLRPPAEPIPAGTRIVADADEGDRPVYLAYPDGRIDPLPATPADLGWNFGYGGGGPGALTNAITSAFARADGIENDLMPTAWVSDQVQYTPDRKQLDISVDELRRRYPNP